MLSRIYRKLANRRKESDRVPLALRVQTTDSAGEAVDDFLGADDDPDRDLLLRAYAAQAAVEWPALDARLEKDA